MKILNIQRMSTEDGPGLRTTLFLKGCPLACQWCHNPESIRTDPHVEWIGVRCIGCRTCVSVCPEKGISIDEEGIHLPKMCHVCTKCVEECPTEALELKGKRVPVDALFEELIKDQAYWGKEGGVTVSGGEALMQYRELPDLLKKLKEAGVHTAVDTCGFCAKGAIDLVLPYTDMFLYDLKLFDTEEHLKFTGQRNEVIKLNFDYLVSQCQTLGKRMWVRTPIIPGATDTDENIRGIASLVGDKVEKWELCAFNNLCNDKYERLGKEWDFKDAGLMTRARMDELVEIAKSAGAKNVVWSGMSRREE